MKKIIDKRQTGKTSKLIKLAENCNGVILVRDNMAKDNTSKLAKAIGCNVKIETYYDFVNNNRSDRSYLNGVYIDDADAFMQFVCDSFYNVRLNGIAIDNDINDENCCESNCRNCMCKDRLF